MTATSPSLLRAEIVREVRRFPELECTFRHGLLQEAALSTLTPTSQRELYGRVGHAMEAYLGDQVDERLEQLAFYFYRSDDTDKGLAYLERAAEHAVDGRGPRTRGAAVGAGSAAGRTGGRRGTRSSSVDRQLAWLRKRSTRRAAAPAPARDRVTAGAYRGRRRRHRRGRIAGARRERDQVRVRRRRGRPLVGILRERLQDRPRQSLGRVGSVRARVRWLGVQVRAGEVEHRLVGERCPARRALVRQASERVDVRCAGRLRAAEHLGREVVERPHHHPRLGEHRVRATLREPEVGQVGRTRLVDDHVRRLDVAMHDAAGVQRVQTRGDVGDDADDVSSIGSGPSLARRASSVRPRTNATAR